MSGIKALRRIQMGKEATAGTAVATTTKWRGYGAIEDTRVTKRVTEDVGLMPGTLRTYVPKYGATLLLESTPATFEQLPHIGEMGIKLITTGVADGSGSGKVYTYTFPTTSIPTLKTYTFEGGDNQAVEKMEYGHVTEFTLTGDEGEAWMMGATVMGRQVAVASTFTTAATLPSVETILFQKSKLYIDAIGGSFGGTLKSNTLVAAQFTWRSGIRQKFTADGNLYFSFTQPTTPEARLRLTFEHDAIGVANKVDWRAETEKKIRILAQGSSFTTAGTYSVKTMIIDVCGKWEKFGKLGDRNGNAIIEGEFVGAYSETAADFGKLVLVNTLTALP
jgi:hypothetical protein